MEEGRHSKVIFDFPNRVCLDSSARVPLLAEKGYGFVGFLLDVAQH